MELTKTLFFNPAELEDQQVLTNIADEGGYDIDKFPGQYQVVYK